MRLGTVLSIHIAGIAKAPVRSVAEAVAVPGRGLQGDRYWTGTGTYCNEPGLGREITLIEIEAIEALERDYGLRIAAGDARRNIVTRGIPLNHLVGREFTVGAVRLRGVRLCEPCMHLERLTRQGVRMGLVHRGGLRAGILSQGTIKPGDAIRVEDA